MSRARSIRFKKRRNKKGFLEIDITSLLDILVILLIFLIKSYNSSGVTLNVPKGIELPNSQSDSINTPGVLIQVSKDTIWVDSKTVLDTQTLPKVIYDQGGRRIVPLYNELVKKKEEIKLLQKQTKEAKKFSGIANLVVDKSLKYSYVKKVMFTAAAAGFKEYKFVVLGVEQ
ncbi:MAG: biopolymer transporter ExbD [Bacteriovoracaceae bacterium]|jgi:biopolymer transport protein ExbD|nr:biopolymer transporter ExbD [Bacteriovoracaceae bacterium]